MTNATDELLRLLDEFEHECYMLRVEASETRAKDEAVRDAYERIREESAQAIAATLGGVDKSEPQGADGNLDQSQIDWLRYMPDGWDGTPPKLGSGERTCELDYDRHCSNCGVCVHEAAVLVRKTLEGGTWTVVHKPASYCPNCGAKIRKTVKR